MSLADYRQRLEEEGCSPTLDEEVGDLPRSTSSRSTRPRSRRLQDPVGLLEPGTKRLDWCSAWRDNSPKPVAIPTTILGLLAGVPGPSNRPTPRRLSRPSKRLHDIRLVEGLLRTPRSTPPSRPRVRPV